MRVVKQVSKVDDYPLSSIDDLFTLLAGEKTFSKLDLCSPCVSTNSIGYASKKLVAM